MGDLKRFRARAGAQLRLGRLAAAIFLCASLACAQPKQPAAAATMLAEPPAPLLPAIVGKLARQASGDAGDGIGRLDAAGLSAEEKSVLAEDGLRRFAESDYSAHGQSDASVSAFQFLDASGATSAYDYFLKPGMRREKLGDNAVSNGDDLLLRSGVNLVRAHFKAGRASMAEFAKELIVHLPKPGGPSAMDPLLPTLLPARGLDPDTVRYALGPVGYTAMGGVLPPGAVGFDKSAEAVTAKSNGGGVLTLILYPTPEIAGEHLRKIQPAIEQKGEAAGTIVLRREGPLLAMTSGAWSAAAAKATVEGIHLRTEVSFDKPMPLEFHSEVRKTYSLLTSITIFCCIAFLAALVMGLFFGGGRALIRVMQGKPAATEPEFLRIDLRGPAAKTPPDPKP